MKLTLLAILLFSVCLVSAGTRYARPGPKNPTVCNKGDTFISGKCWRPCPAGFALHGRFSCWEKCRAGETTTPTHCITKNCKGGYRPCGTKCCETGCRKGYVSKNIYTCYKLCKPDFKTRGTTCYKTNAKAPECEKYTRHEHPRKVCGFNKRLRRKRGRSCYKPRCPPSWSMIRGKCWGICKPGFVVRHPHCIPKICTDPKRRKYRRSGPKNPTVCNSGWVYRNNGCHQKCPPGYSNQWNNFYRCQKNCKRGERHSKGVCYTSYCNPGYIKYAGKCYRQYCPGHARTSRNVVSCWRNCTPGFTVSKKDKSKCVNLRARPENCQSKPRGHIPKTTCVFHNYRAKIINKKHGKPHCPGGWRMEQGKCWGPCRPSYTIVGKYCHLKKCMGLGFPL